LLTSGFREQLFCVLTNSCTYVLTYNKRFVGGKLVIFVKDILVHDIKVNEACRKYRKHATDFQTQTERLKFLFIFTYF
jgi:hypothetical protein